MTDRVYILVTGGHIHLARRSETGALLVDEQCNLDDAVERTEINPDELERAELVQFECGHCFPETIPAE